MYQEAKLCNGIKLISEYTTDDDLVCVNLFLPVGIEFDDEKLGIGKFVCSMLLRGSKKYDVLGLAYELEVKGIKIDITRADDYISFSMLMHKDYFDAGIKLFKEIFFYPVFPEEEINKLKKEVLNALKARYDHITNVADDIFFENIYDKKHPYSWLTSGTEESIKALNRNDLIEFHNNYFIKSSPVVTVIGNFDKTKLSSFFESSFKYLEPALCNTKRLDMFKNIKIQRENKVIKKYKDFNQSYIMTGFVLPSVSSKYFLSLKIINAFLGDGMSSLFFRKIREELGLVYEIGSIYPAHRFDSYFAVHLGLDKKNIKLALDTIDKTLDDFYKKGIDILELDKIKNKLVTRYIMKHESKLDKGLYLGLWEILGKGWKYDLEYIEMLNNVDIDMIAETIEQIFKPSYHVIAIVTQ